jgi:hypothetical protein
LTALGGFINALAQVEFTPPSYGLKRYDPIDATIDDLPLILLEIPFFRPVIVAG